MTIFAVFILAYLFILIGMGVWFSRKIKTQDDFVVAGRTLTAPILVGTLMATWTGSGSIFSGGSLAYHNGYAALWSSVGAWIGILAVYAIAKKIRRGGKMSVPDIIEDRFDHWVALAVSIVTIIAYVVIVSYQFKAGGRVVLALGGEDFRLFGFDPMMTGILLTAFFAIGYTVLAGMLSVTYTDVANGVIMLLGVIIAMPFLFSAVGGWSGFVSQVPAVKWEVFGHIGGIKAMALLIPTMLLLMGDANMYQRLLSAKDEKEAKKSVAGWLICVILIEILIVSLAFLGSVLEPNLSETERESIILLLAIRHVPTIVGCLLLAAIVSIIVSTADSFLLVPATNLSHNVYQRYFRPQASQKELILVNRMSVVFLGICAFLMISFFQTILEAAYAAYTIYGASITPVLLAAFIWKKASERAALFSVLGGAATTIYWEVYKKTYNENLFGLDAVFPALFVSLFLLIVVSFISPTKKSLGKEG